MSGRSKILAASLIPVLVIAAWYLFRSSERKPNVLFVTLDTVRSDHCSAYGYRWKTTPKLDEVAAQGVRFETAYAPMATTGPSHATMLTSLYPVSHGVLKNGHLLRPEYSTLAEILAANGYATAAFVSAFALHSRFGLNQGFSVYEDDFESGRTRGALLRRANETTRLAAAWLHQRQTDQPFFLWVHYYDPHTPYDPPEPYNSKFNPGPDASDLDFQIAAYDGEIHYADDHMGLLLEYLNQEGLAEDTLVVIAGDHGEGLMQHGHMGHGLFIYEEAVKVPFVFRWPEQIPAGKVVQGPVQLLDLVPTILELLKIPANSAFQGISLVSYMRGSFSADPNRYVFLERRHYETDDRALKAIVEEGFHVKGNKFGIRSGDWKFIEAKQEGTTELYRLNDDPNELKNLSEQFPDQVTKFSRSILSWRNQHAGTTKPQPISPEDQERLKALGYVQ